MYSSGPRSTVSSPQSDSDRRYVFLREQLFRDRLQLQIRRALVDLTDLRVAKQLFDRVILDEAVTAEQVHCQGGHMFRDLGREQFAHRGLLQKGPARVAQACGVVDEEPGGFDLRGRTSQLELHALERCDGV